MKNLLIFVDPIKDFNREHRTLAKIQIDWSLKFCRPEDIMLVTNFPYEYQGVKAIQVEDDCYYPAFNRATKVPVINRMFEKELINGEFWFRDFDAFQLVETPDIKSKFAITLYGKTGKKNTPEYRWNAGSFFFNEEARDIFKEIEKTMWHNRIDEESAVAYMIERGFSNYEKLDSSWCVHIYNPKIENPKVLHFHPYKPHHRKLFEIPKELEEIFEKYGIS